MLMESATLTDADSPESTPDFAFAFNDANFSDRILRIEILQGLATPKADYGDNLGDLGRYRKRRRGDPKNNAERIESTKEREAPTINVDTLILENGNQEDGANEMIEELLVAADVTTNQSGIRGEIRGNEAVEDNEELLKMDSSAVQVKTIHVSSPILAAKSPYFYKLFSNGMRESEQKEITLQIHASEEEAFMDLLRFIYSNTLPRTTLTALLDVLVAADKYEVALCMIYCTKFLQCMPMTRESALLYLELPPNVLMAKLVVPLANAAKQYLAEYYKDINKYQNEVLELPLAGIKAVLSSDNLQLASEDAVYDFMLKWAREHYPDLDERRDIINKHLLRYIRFPAMSTRKLRKVLTCKDINPELAYKVVLDALFFKADEAPYRRQRSAVYAVTKDSIYRFVERKYKYHSLKVVQFESPHESCIVYLDLKREECAQLFPNGRIDARAFYFGGQGFFLSGHCCMEYENSPYSFGLFLGMQEKASASLPVDYMFAARTKPSKEFVHKCRGRCTFTGGKVIGFRNLFGVLWDAFVAEDSPYFINGVLHLRAELTVKE